MPKRNKIPERKCDATVVVDGVSLPVWILEDHYVVVADLSNESEVVLSSKGDKPDDVIIVPAIREAMAGLKVEGITLKPEQREFYYGKE